MRYSVADFFRESPWSDEEMRLAWSRFGLNDAMQRALDEGIEPIIYVSVDDSLTVKDKDTKALEGVDWFDDHNASTLKLPIYRNGAVHISCRVQVGQYSYTFAGRLYRRSLTVRRLNRKRPKDKRLKFKSKYSLAREMLAELKPFIPKGWKVYVLFDSWYASALADQIHPATAALVGTFCAPSNPIELSTGFKSLNGTSGYGTSATPKLKGKRQTALPTIMSGRCSDICTEVRDQVCVLIWVRHRRDKSPKYYLCTDLTLSAQTMWSASSLTHLR